MPMENVIEQKIKVNEDPGDYLCDSISFKISVIK